MPHKEALRSAISNAMHDSHEFILQSMHVAKTQKIPLKVRINVLRSLAELKRNKEAYDFGPTQLILLDRLIKEARRANTPEKLHNIHRLTCGLGIKKH